MVLNLGRGRSLRGEMESWTGFRKFERLDEWKVGVEGELPADRLNLPRELEGRFPEIHGPDFRSWRIYISTVEIC